MIGKTSQLSGLFCVLNTLGLVESGSSRYDLDELEENDDQTMHHATQCTSLMSAILAGSALPLALTGFGHRLTFVLDWLPQAEMGDVIIVAGFAE
jgi:hypothetical protein